MKKLTICIIVILIAFCKAQSKIRLPSLLADHAVLQQNSTVTLWGWADPDERIIIKTSWNKQPVETITDGNAHWIIKMKTPPAGGPFQISFEGSNKIVLNDVMIGEVWICAGQSNMEYGANKGIVDAREELPKAYNKNIRFFTVNKDAAETLQENCTGNWAVCDSASLARFSAVGYFFGKRVQHVVNVPIGLINISWEGTPIECWMPADSIYNYPEFKNHAYNLRIKSSEKWPVYPASIYNAMVSPLKNYQVVGVTWYQGESNAGYPRNYADLFEKMVKSWRTDWKKSLPFYYVQIAPFRNYGVQDTPALVREQQVKAMRIENTGMVVTTDLVDDVNNIHPPYKQEVGNRLANWALADHYAIKTVSYKSPVYDHMQIEKGKIKIFFRDIDSDLTTNGKPISEFEIAGADRKFIVADAKIKGKTVVVFSKLIRKPVAVRFAFNNGPQPNLKTTNGLPVSPFRTDTW